MSEHEDTSPKELFKPVEVILDEFMRLHNEEELIRLAWRARKAKRLWLSDIIQAEIQGRTLE